MTARPRPASALLRARAAASVALIGAALAATLSGCAPDWSAQRPAPAPLGELKPGFLPSATPSPAATIHPDAGSWSDVRPAPGYRVVLLHAGSDRPSRVLADAVRTWAAEHSVDLREVDGDGDHVAAIVAAMRLRPDLIVSTGDALVDPLALVTASHLDRQFLVVGAEVAEPTANVTAVDWRGASFRGEGLGASSDYDAASFTPARAGRAVRAGVAAVLSDARGIVVWVD